MAAASGGEGCRDQSALAARSQGHERAIKSALQLIRMTTTAICEVPCFFSDGFSSYLPALITSLPSNQGVCSHRETWAATEISRRAAPGIGLCAIGQAESLTTLSKNFTILFSAFRSRGSKEFVDTDGLKSSLSQPD